LGSRAICEFLDQYFSNLFEYAIAEPDINNLNAIKTYEKSGFKTVMKLAPSVQRSFILILLIFKPKIFI
jgi:hypothetical protein